MPEIRESGNFKIKKVKYYPKREMYGEKIHVSGYFELILECKENKEASEIEITIFDSEFERLTRTKFAFG